MWWVGRISEAGNDDQPFFLVGAPERGHAAEMYFIRTVLDGCLKVLRIVVLASKDDDIFQPATDEQFPFSEESEIPGSEV
jgi:hypothetical protein